MYVFPMCAKTLQSCPTLYKPMDCNPPDSSVHGILQARILEWVLCPPQGDRPTQGLNPHLLCLLHWQVGSLPLVPPGKLYTSCPSTSLLPFLQTAPIFWQPLFPSRVSKHVPTQISVHLKDFSSYSYSGKRVWLKWQCSKIKVHREGKKLFKWKFWAFSQSYIFHFQLLQVICHLSSNLLSW